jgi:dGTPase
MVKHSRDLEPGEFPELEEYRPGEKPPLEAQIIDIADEIAYNASDLDDGFSAGMFGVSDIVRAVPHYTQLWDAVDTQFAGASEQIRFNEALRMLIDWLVTGLLDGTADAVKSAGVASVEDIRACPERLVRFTPGASETNLAMKLFLRERVYYAPPLIAERQQSSKQVAELFQYFLDNPNRLPERDRGDPLHRVVCDHIAGMTDGYFRRTHAELLGV